MSVCMCIYVSERARDILAQLWQLGLMCMGYFGGEPLLELLVTEKSRKFKKRVGPLSQSFSYCVKIPLLAVFSVTSQTTGVPHCNLTRQVQGVDYGNCTRISV